MVESIGLKIRRSRQRSVGSNPTGSGSPYHLAYRINGRESESRQGRRTLMQKFDPNSIVILIDSREPPETAYRFPGYETERVVLKTADYSIKHLTDTVALERKTEDDFISSVIHDRSRFKAMMHRMMAYEERCLLVESTWQRLTEGVYQSRAAPTSIVNTVASWAGRFKTPIMLVGCREEGERFAGMFLRHAARRAFEQAAPFLKSAKDGQPDEHDDLRF